MGIILIDGPEKAGKTTLIHDTARLLGGALYRHWRQPSSYRDYLAQAYSDLHQPEPVFWDRGWPSDMVYGQLLPAESRAFPADPWLGEWLVGRLLASGSLKIILAPSGRILEARRAAVDDSSDHKVAASLEAALYRYYGDLYGYQVYPALSPNVLAQMVIEHPPINFDYFPNYLGPIDARIVFVADMGYTDSDLPLPFIREQDMGYGRLLGTLAFQCGWSDIAINPNKIRHRPLVIACGDKARLWCRRHGIAALEVPHPAWLYRRSNSQAYIAATETIITTQVLQAIKQPL